MDNDVVTGAGRRPLLIEADMNALAEVARQAGLDGIDLKALAHVLDAAQSNSEVPHDRSQP